jgi:hypothetical protein
LAIEDGQWESLDVTQHPGARWDYCTTFDPSRQEMLVYGGAGDEGALTDLWAYDLAGAGGWTQIPVSGPQPRTGASLAYDPVRDRLVLFGGISSTNECLNDVWFLSRAPGSNWVEVSPTGAAPMGRGDAAMVYDPPRDRMLILGGRVPGTPAGTVPGSVLVLTLNETPAWLPLQAPFASPYVGSAEYAILVYEPLRDRFLMVNHSVFGILVVTTTQASWEFPAPPGDGPPICIEQTAVYDESRQRLVVYGGAANGQPVGNAWALELEGALRWRRLYPAGAVPPARSGHGAVYDASHDRMVIFGGRSNEALDDVVELDWTVPTGVGAARSQGGLVVEPFHPNPVRSNGRLTFVTSERGPASVRIFDIRGRLAHSRDLGILSPGRHEAEPLDTADLDAGVYLVQVQSGSRAAGTKLVISK